MTQKTFLQNAAGDGGLSENKMQEQAFRAVLHSKEIILFDASVGKQTGAATT